jgi:hypothetical protein
MIDRKYYQGLGNIDFWQITGLSQQYCAIVTLVVTEAVGGVVGIDTNTYI